MKIQHDRIDGLYRIFANEKIRNILKFIETDGAKTFSEITIHLGYTDAKSRRSHTNLVSHYLNHLKKTYVVRHDILTHTYYLTRLGTRALKMFEEFEKFYTEYDMNDVNQDGFVEQVTIVRMRTE